MPKMKTHKSAAKRFKRRNSGSIARGRTPRGHKMTKKSSKRKRNLRRGSTTAACEVSRVKKMAAGM